MKLPICTEDAEKGKLCNECKEKLEEGEINQTDVELSRILYKLYQKNTIPEDTNLVRTEMIKENDKELVLALVEGDPSTLIGRGGRIIRLISDKLGKKIRVIKNGTPIQILNDLITPVRACGINILYKRNGDKQKIITLPKERKKRIKMDLDKAEIAVSKITGQNYKLRFI